MGHQIIGLYSINSTSDKDLIKVNNHYHKTKTHFIYTIKNSLLNNVLGDTLLVNSRHKYALNKV